MYLFEIFNTTYKLKPRYVSDSVITFSFTDGKQEYYASATHMSKPEIEEIEEDYGITITSDNLWYVEFTVGDEGFDTAEITGNAKSSIRVFSTIAEFLKGVVNKVHPDGIAFEAKEPSRVKLYNRMAQRLARTLNYKPIISNSPYGTTYLIVNPKAISNTH